MKTATIMNHLTNILGATPTGMTDPTMQALMAYGPNAKLPAGALLSPDDLLPPDGKWEIHSSMVLPAADEKTVITRPGFDEATGCARVYLTPYMAGEWYAPLNLNTTDLRPLNGAEAEKWGVMAYTKNGESISRGGDDYYVAPSEEEIWFRMLLMTPTATPIPLGE